MQNQTTIPADGQELKTENIMEANVSLNAPVIAGSRTIYTWKEGIVTGRIAGKILPIGGEFATIIGTTNKIDVRSVIQTHDGATIYLTYSGYIFADTETFKLIRSGRGYEVDPSKYYFRTNPMFETSSSEYDWLNHTVAIGVGTFTKTGMSYKIYAIK